MKTFSIVISVYCVTAVGCAEGPGGTLDAGALPESWRAGLPEREPERSRHIADFIAGMTDRFAIDQYARIHGRVPEGLRNV